VLPLLCAIDLLRKAPQEVSYIYETNSIFYHGEKYSQNDRKKSIKLSVTFFFSFLSFFFSFPKAKNIIED
jgi:hypothetical protein